MFKLGEVRVPDDKDFEIIKSLALNHNDWTVDYDKSNIKVWIKKNELSSFNFMKIKAEFPDVSASTAYNCIHDSEYRVEWDDRMLEGSEICWITPNSDIGYYAVKSPKPFKNRDFVTQRCWLDFGDSKEKIVFNHSVNHVKQQPRKNFIRGISYMTAYYFVPTSKTSCTMYYLTQSNPGGTLPAWIINKASKVLAPKMSKKLYKACLKYDKWKSKHNPSYMPWIHPDQITVPRIDWNDILSFDENQLKLETSIDESQINQNDCENDLNDQDNDKD